MASPAKRRRRLDWRDTLDRAVLQLPRTCTCFERIEVDDRLEYDLPRGHRLAGQILCHVFAAVDKILERQKPCIFKAGYTHCPIYRFYNDVFGYIHERDRWEKMTVVYVSHEVISTSFVEAAIIQRHKGSLYQFIFYIVSFPMACAWLYIVIYIHYNYQWYYQPRRVEDNRAFEMSEMVVNRSRRARKVHSLCI